MSQIDQDVIPERTADAMHGSPWSLVGRETLVGVTVALVAIPQCIGFARISGLPAESGIISAVAMGLVSMLFSRSPRLVIGPAITASTILLAVLRTVEPSNPARWPSLAATLAVLVGILTIVGGLLRVGRLIRFVSRSVIIGLVFGSALLTIGSQLAASIGVSAGAEPMLLGMLWQAATELPNAHWAAFIMTTAVVVFMRLGARIGPRFPAAFAALIASAAAVFLLERIGIRVELRELRPMPWQWSSLSLHVPTDNATNLLAGATAICLVGLIQNLAIGKAMAQRTGERFDPQRELWSLGLANVAAGAVNGFPGSASFARSALADVAGAQTRLSTFAAAAATGLIAAAGAPMMHYITSPAIAGVLIATAISMIDWHELRALTRDRHDRFVLATIIACVFLVPIHWALLIGLAVSFVILLRRVSRIHLLEMVRSTAGPFREQDIDSETGMTAITMIQIEGPVFFAHADPLARRLQKIFHRGPRVIILRMRRTQQVDYTILAALRLPVHEYLRAGGHLVICGLTPTMRREILNSPLGEVVSPDFLLETTREVFGSAHVAIGLAQCILDVTPMPDRAVFRTEKMEPVHGVAVATNTGH